tara:strand:- start:233 stop:769 length:537 start_codon:yes stop_codon:yes gene_type:complete
MHSAQLEYKGSPFAEENTGEEEGGRTVAGPSVIIPEEAGSSFFVASLDGELDKEIGFGAFKACAKDFPSPGLRTLFPDFPEELFERDMIARKGGSRNSGIDARIRFKKKKNMSVGFGELKGNQDALPIVSCLRKFFAEHPAPALTAHRTPSRCDNVPNNRIPQAAHNCSFLHSCRERS